jgi:dihydropteroate synthase
VLPVVRGIVGARPGAVVSVDTRSARVAEVALSAGASVVNDVSGLADPAMRALVARTGVRAVVMHTRGTPADMASRATYGEVVDEVLAELGCAVAVALADGVRREQIVLDAGLGFAKRPEHNPPLVRATARLVALGYPVLVGASRKRFVGELTGRADPADRLAGSLGAALAAWQAGASFLRVHDVAATRDALAVFAACRP